MEPRREQCTSRSEGMQVTMKIIREIALNFLMVEH